MAGFNNILFPTDLSDLSKRMVPCVLSMAETFDAEIHLIYVGRLFEKLAGIYIPHASIARFESEICKGASLRMQSFATALERPERPCHTKVVIGDTVDEIVKYVKAEDIDLVMIGTHGRKGVERLLFGSVAERVIRDAKTAVLCLHPYSQMGYACAAP